MADIEKLLNTAADSSEFEGWNDALSYMVSSVQKKYAYRKLSEDELSMVAGGVHTPEELLRDIRAKREKEKYV